MQSCPIDLRIRALAEKVAFMERIRSKEVGGDA